MLVNDRIENEFDRPSILYFDAQQSIFIASTADNCLVVDINKGLEVDIDVNEEIGDITNILYGDEKFYLVCNRRFGKLGFFLLTIDCQDPEAPGEYFINWSNKLDIADCDMALMTNKVTGKRSDVVVSYKNIGINTYNVFVFDLVTRLIKYNFEAMQFWESPVKGFLLQSNDFMILNKDGINLLSLGEKKGRCVKDFDGLDRWIHSLGSCNFLKLEPTNHLLFACQRYDNR